MRCIDLIGKKFGRWTVVAREQSGVPRTLWVCKCECGGQKSVISTTLRNGNSQSCGCLQREVTSRANTLHGLSTTPTYRCWLAMLARCENSNTPRYADWGGRGITVCKRWHKFTNFVHDMGMQPSGLTLERTNNKKGYSLANCVWATPKQQANNRRRRSDCPVLTYDGTTRTLIEWSALTELTVSAIKARLAKNWTIKQVLTAPLRTRGSALQNYV